jgi:hypothetical protein
MILKLVKLVIKNKSDLLAIINKCDAVRRVLERATTNGVTEDNLRGSFGDALLHLSE